MPNLTPVSSFDNVPELETTTLALGGPGGPMNLPAQALLNRTQWLKDNAAAGSAGPYAVGTGTANVCAATFTPPITALADGLKLRFLAAATNTGPATFAPNGLTAQPIVGGAYAALQGGEILADGEVELTWNATLSVWVITAQAGGSPQVPDATQSKHSASKGQVDQISANLASTAAGKGAALVGFLQSGAGAVARTVQDKMRESVSVRDFGAVGDGVADDTAAIQAAITALQGNAISQALLFPPGNYLITGTLTCTGFLSLVAQGKFAAHIVKSGAGDLLTIGSGAIDGLVIDHQGASGSSIVNAADNLHIKDCGFNPGSSNASPVIVLKHANCVVQDCTFTTSNASQWCVDVVADTGNFCINGSITGGTMYGGGNGVRFRTGTGGRPEGWDVTGAKIIVTGAASVEVQSCLSVDLTGCTIDQASGYGVRLAPAGGGIDALSVDDNYISTATASTTGFGVAAVAGSGGIRSLSITNNHIELCGTGCVLDAQMIGVGYIGNTSGSIATRHLDYAGATAVTIADNFFLGGANLLRLVDGATGGQISVAGNRFDTSGSVTYTPTDPTRFEFSANTGKKFSGWSSLVTGPIASGTSGYYPVPHGLAVTPSLGKIVAITAQGSGGFINPTCTIAAVDATNVTVQATYTVSSAGTLRINVHASA